MHQKVNQSWSRLGDSRAWLCGPPFEQMDRGRAHGPQIGPHMTINIQTSSNKFSSITGLTSCRPQSCFNSDNHCSYFCLKPSLYFSNLFFNRWRIPPHFLFFPILPHVPATVFWVCGSLFSLFSFIYLHSYLLAASGRYSKGSGVTGPWMWKQMTSILPLYLARWSNRSHGSLWGSYNRSLASPFPFQMQFLNP